MKFVYQAKSYDGKESRGEIDAADEAEARVRLRAQKLIPVRIVQPGGREQGANRVRGRAIKSKDMQIFTRQLSTLLNSGIPIMQAIESLSSGSRNPILVGVLRQVSADISQGKRLADAIGEHPATFSKFYVNMVRAGEESGNLDTVLNRLSAYIEKSVKLNGKVKGALVYPAIILIIAAVVVAGLMIFVIPKFQLLFANFGGQLPVMTRIVIAMSHFFMTKWYLIVGFIGAAYFGSRTWLATPVGRQTFDMFVIDVPIFGELVQKGGIAKFSRTLSTLLGAGVGIIEALEIASKTVGNYVLERAILRASAAITEGRSLTAPLSKEKYIPSMVTQMIGVGEQTGTLDQMLAKIADFYEDEVDVAVGSMTTIIEPLMMVVLGAIVAFLVISMYLPIFNLAAQVG